MAAKPARSESERPLEPSLEFMQRLWRLDHALELLSARMERTQGVTSQQRLIVRIVGKHPTITAGELATLLHVTPSTVSVALQRLAEKGVILRRRAPDDKRRSVLELTAKGVAIDQPVGGTVEHAVARLLKTVAAQDLEMTTAVLDMLTTLLDSELVEAPSDAPRPLRR